LFGIRAALVDEAAGMGVTAADFQAARVDIADVGAAAEVVDVIANLADLAVSVEIEVLPRLANVQTARDDVKQVRNDARGQKTGAVFVVIVAPRIACPLGEDLEFLRLGMIAPDAGVEGHAVLVRRARLADARVRENAVAAIEPAVRSTDEAVERL